MAVSNDNNPGSWTTLKEGKPVLTSALGTKGIRDPSLIIPEDRSKYYLIATVRDWGEILRGLYRKQPTTNIRLRISK